jgi:hypothetical protein
MGAHRTLAQVVEEMQGSRHRGARVLRFIYRNRKKHRRIIKALLERQRFHEEICDRRFAQLQHSAAAEGKKGRRR